MRTNILSVALLSSVLVHFTRSATADDCLVIAHRGGVVNDQIIENSAAAIEAAVDRGYWMIEIDVRESKDGHLVVHHDADFRRYYGDPRRLDDMTWSEIAALRATPGNTRPLEFHEIATLCAGRLRVMIDTKGPSHPTAFYEEMEAVLRRHDLLESAYFIGTDESQAYFADKARTSIGADRLAAAAPGDSGLADRHFLFMHGRDMTTAHVEQARQRGLTIVPSVNTFHYLSPKNHLRLAIADIHRLRRLGVTQFQIDSPYDEAVQGPLPPAECGRSQ